MLLINLFEKQNQTFFILDLPEPARAKALKAFEQLCHGQRHGDPEKLGGASLFNKGIHCSGLYAGLTEHVGDITHRMTEEFESFKGLWGNCREKVDLGISRIEDNDMERQVRANFEYRSDPERDEDAKKWKIEPSRFTGSLEDFQNFWRSAGKLYGDAHAKLPVWNEAQWHAREAAVACGYMQFYAALKHLKALKSHMKNAKDWIAYCGQVTIDAAGNPVPYGALREDRSVHLYKKLPDTFGSAGDILAQYGYEQVGMGNYANVYAKPGEKTVLKLFKDEDTGYKAFIDFCYKHRSNSSFPRISKVCMRIGNYNAIRMERLSPWSGYGCHKDVAIIQTYFYDKLGRQDLAYQKMGRPWPYPTKEIEEQKIAEANQFMTDEPNIKQGCDLLIAAFAGRFEFDIELKNIMIREQSNDMVFVDPIWDDRQPYN
jgi:hypothetical protein